jgi:hypothetical protein
MNDTEIKEIVYPSEFNGAEEYAVYGWAKWHNIKNRAGCHEIFRLSTTPELKNYSNLGDRTLVAFLC